MSRAETLVRPTALPGASMHLGAVALACLVVLSLLPIALIEMPAMVDYPNHLARMSILARAGTPAAHPLYEVAWAPYPNLAMDLLVPPLARLVGVETATKLFYLAAQLLIVGGAMALSWVVRGRVVGAGLTACLFLYAMPFAFGFMNFEFALGLALLAIAAWIGLETRSPPLRLGAHAIAVATLFFAHLFALGLYGFTIGIIELWRFWRERPPLARFVGLAAGMAAPVLVIGLLAGLGGGAVGGSGTFWFLSAKLFWLSMPNGWSRPFASLLTAVLAGAIALAFRRGALGFVGPGRWLAIAFLLLFLAMPFRLFDTGFVDGRVLIAAILILPAFTAASTDIRPAYLAGIVAIALANLAFVAWVQRDYRDTYRSAAAAFETLPREARLLVAAGDEAGDPPADLMAYPTYHMGTLAAHVRDAFVPTLFTYPGKQPIRPRADLLSITPLEGGPYPMGRLEAHAAGAPPGPEARYVSHWTRDFDYLLLVQPGATDPMPGRLERVASGPRFVLYRIVKGGSETPR